MTRSQRSALSIVGLLCLGVACDKAPASQSSSGRRSDSNVVAHVGDHPITLDEVDEKALAANMKAFQELYEARRQALDALVEETLLDQEASSRGITKEELVKKEIASKVAEVSQQDVETFYTQNANRLGGQTLEQLSGQIRQYLQARNQAAARQGFLSSLRSKTKVDVALDPPRVVVQVAANERYRGPKDAPVTLVEYSDFQ